MPKKFTVNNGDRKCFHVKKQGDNLAITGSPYGEIRLDILDTNTGAMAISCLFGESIQINSKTVSENCTSQAMKTFKDWPQAVFTSEEEKSARNFMFSFVGLGLGHAPVFNCKERK